MARQVVRSEQDRSQRTLTGTRRSNVLESLTRLIVLGAPVFYTLGRVYSEGYWGTLGVSSGLMMARVEDYVYLGFIVIVNGLALALPHAEPSWWLAPLASLALFSALGFVFWLGAKTKSWLSPKLRSVSIRIRRFFSRRRSAVRALSTASSFMAAMSALMLAFFACAGALLLPLVIAHSVGKLRAEQVKSDLQANKGGYSQVLSEATGRMPVRLVECSEQYCVLYVGGHLVPAPKSTISWTIEANGASTSSGESP